jgi:hydroxyacylglutathione hydrolase
VDTGKVKYLVTGHGDYTTNLLEIKNRFKDSYDYIFDMRNAIKSGDDFDLNKLLERYDFPKIMTKFHEGNLKVFELEMKEK